MAERSLTVVLFLVLACLVVSFRFNANLAGRASGFGSGFGDSATGLCAKKKPSKGLISDDLLSQFDEPLEFASSERAGESTDKVSLKNKKKGGKPIISSELLSSFIEEEGGEDEDDDKAAKKKKNEKKGKGLSAVGAVKVVVEEEEEEEEEEVVKVFDPNEMTIEQKVRKDKPSARVRFTESSQPGFVSMGLEKVGLMYGNEVILNDASFRVSTGDRLGLVGPNGGGKSTQLKILSGELEPTTGEILKSSANLRVAFLRQEFVEGLAMDKSLQEELMTAFVEEARILQDIAACEEEVGATTDDPKKMENVLDRLQKLQDQAIARECYALEAKVLKVMDSMGFTAEDGAARVSSFSGGWKMRIGLAKILLLDPNVLLLDEPTNHMDLDSVIWLENFLVSQNLPMVVVSHDREFLDKVCNKIVDVEEGATHTYLGNYSKFLVQKKARLTAWRDKFEKQNRYVKEEEKWIKKARGDPTLTPQVKSREASLEKFKTAEDWVDPPPRERKFRFRFPEPPRCGELVLEAENLVHGYGEGRYKTLFRDVNIQVEKGNRIGFIGPNGSGKSTMMRILMGLEEPQGGFAEHGSMSVVANYYAQNQADALDLNMTVLETVQHNAPSSTSLTEVRTLLGQFMFKGDDADKKIGVLSGGEKARVALCKMMLEPANLLLLDEPTNHLDITSKEVLEDALLNYGGSVLIISHDRYFMSQAVNTIFSFHDKTVERFDCDYHDYMLKISEGSEDQEGSGPSLQEKVQSRYVDGDKYKITNAPEVKIEEAKGKDKKKNFGGSGITGGNLFKGIKNAKRYAGKD
eukprot:CAMPEP_0173191444 /NCGR_PEP_ID=MMETSP1141-20130122/12884_1 /TAXON_ID=483371 /ORGANISM="non described non described, Strain CCMP2298" /LENGTH=805 /DNA_ID=CAMNT_0014115625 /DNA_START=80 /DNA_END=2497 /DNA_ORIENTATION=-